jgi:uncharacterized protein (DUF1501 family)
VLVVLEVNGGNDGLNTVVPYRDEVYAKARPTLALAKKDVLAIDEELGFHPALGGFARLLEQGQLALVPGAGYPEPNLSHPVALSTYHTACTDYHGRRGFGWLGRGLDEPSVHATPAAVLAGQDEVPRALSARRAPIAVIRGLEEYLDDEAPPDARAPESELAVVAHVRSVLLDARATAQRLRASGGSSDGSAYPPTELGRDLALIAHLVRAGLETPVYYAVQRGYDTHAIQAEAHAARLGELGGALEAFVADLRAAGVFDRVLVLLFSEFGRRVEENASRGTDHGTAGPMFLAGPAVRPGVHGARLDLTKLVDGNPTCTVDFRSIYANVLRSWLGWNATRVLGGEYAELELLRV